MQIGYSSNIIVERLQTILNNGNLVRGGIQWLRGSSGSTYLPIEARYIALGAFMNKRSITFSPVSYR